MNMKTDQKSDRGQEGPLIGRVTFANGEAFEYANPAEFLKVIQEELPYHPTSGFRYKVLTDDPKIRKAGMIYCTTCTGRKIPARWRIIRIHHLCPYL